MVALISRAGHTSAWVVVAVKMAASVQIVRMDLFIKYSDFTSRSVARTVPRRRQAIPPG
jgi:hypothetical protein